MNSFSCSQGLFLQRARSSRPDMYKPVRDKRVRDMARTYSQMHRINKYSQHSSIIWPVWLNG